jgi:hypothetical protein
MRLLKRDHGLDGLELLSLVVNPSPEFAEAADALAEEREADAA